MPGQEEGVQDSLSRELPRQQRFVRILSAALKTKGYPNQHGNQQKNTKPTLLLPRGGSRRGLACRYRGSNFSLSGLGLKKVCPLEEWDFKGSTLPRSFQFIWMEGKPVAITTPQNDQGGKVSHKLHQGIAPIVITTKGEHIQPLQDEARAAELQDQPSEAFMLLRRLRVFHFMKKAKPDVKATPCPRCFSRFVQDNV